MGVDLARGLAVLGMFAVHVGPDTDDRDGIPAGLLDLAQGRSSALFAMLAGLSMALMTGRRNPPTGRGRRQGVTRLVVRAFLLIALGTALTALDTPVLIILAYYGVYFLLAAPLVRFRSRTLAVVACGLALVGPVLSFLARRADVRTGWSEVISDHDPLVALSGEGVVQFLCTGAYPAATWMPFVVAGMAIGRLDLHAGSVSRRLAVLGPLLALGGYGGSWLALNALDGTQALGEAAAEQAEEGDLSQRSHFGVVSTESPAWLLVSTPHTGTTFDIAGTLGTALIVLVLALVTVHHFRWVAVPLVAVGRMPLTVYVGHIAAIALLGLDLETDSLLPLAGFLVVACLMAMTWLRFFRRGPLEQLLHAATALVSIQDHTGGRRTSTLDAH